jgi:16S rRNA G966 N2-methylase RsmD
MTYPTHPAADLFPMLEGAELAELADDIREHGLVEAVWLWNDPDRGELLLDGRNRVAACEKVGVPLRTRTYTGDDPIGFSISQNMKRRHLTTGQKAAVASEVEPMYAAEAAKRMLAGKRQEVEQAYPVADPPQGQAKPRALLSRDKAAATVGTSGRRVQQFKRVQQAAPDLATKVKAGTLALDRADRVIRDREAEQRRIQQARREAATEAMPSTVDIRHGDFREVLADLSGVDAIITDPPYPREFLPLLGDLAAWADQVLAPDGVLAVLIGQTHLPDVYQLLSGYRPYRWTCAYLTEGPGYVSHPRRVQSNWKPLILYGNGPRLADIVRSEASDADAKNNHKWGQDYGAFHTIVERLTTRGQTVVDPFMGAGTTLLAAHALGRHTIGCDIDPAAVATSKERLT